MKNQVTKRSTVARPYQRLHNDIEKIMAATAPDEKLPSEPDLSKQLGVSRATLREVMRSFEVRGLIRRQQGIGTFVIGLPPVIESGLEVLESIETSAKKIKLEVSMGALQISEIKATSELAGFLKVSEGSNLVEVTRVIYTDSRPVAYLKDILPENILSKEELKEGFTGSVLDFLLNKGVTKLSHAKTDISAIGATHDIARLLQIQRGDVLLLLTSQLFTNRNAVIAYSTSHFIPGYFRFHVVRRLAGMNK
jgi:GntR family transcriptional regulator